jgi:hypothetical protein
MGLKTTPVMMHERLFRRHTVSHRHPAGKSGTSSSDIKILSSIAIDFVPKLDHCLVDGFVSLSVGKSDSGLFNQ